MDNERTFIKYLTKLSGKILLLANKSELKQRFNYKMALFKAFPSRFILAIVTLNVSVSVAQMEDYPDFNESELFDLNSLLASSCDASQTCKGQIKCPACVKIDWIPREPYIQKNTGEMATFSPYNGILTCKYFFKSLNSYLIRAARVSCFN